MRRRRVATLVRVARVLLAKPDGRHYAYETATSAGVRPYVVYSLFNGMMDKGWIVDDWENPAEAVGRPPRRYYQLTDEGCHQLQVVLLAAAVLEAATDAIQKKRVGRARFPSYSA